MTLQRMGGSNEHQRSDWTNAPASLGRLIHVEWSGQGVTWPNWRMWMLAAGVEDYSETGGLYLDNSGLALQAAVDGQGVALGDSSLVSDDLAAGLLVQPFALTIKGPPQFATGAMLES